MTRLLLAAGQGPTAVTPPSFTVRPYSETIDAAVIAANTTIAAYGTDVIGAGRTRVTYPDGRLRFTGLLPNVGGGRVVNSLMAGAAPFSLHVTVTGADRVGLHFDANGSDPTHGILISIDGHPTTSGRIPLTSASILLDLPSTGVHHVRADLASTGFAALDLPPGGTASAATLSGPSLMIYGDSWVEGASYGPSGNDSHLQHMAWLTGRLLDVPCAVAGIGGTSYTDATSTGYRSATRLNQIQAVAPDYLLVFGTINDNGSSADSIQTAAAAMYADLATRLPATRVVVCGPESYNNASNANVTNRNAVKVAALAAGLTFIDPIAEQWGNGTGNSTAPTGDGNADVIHNGNNINHLTLAGNRYYAERLAGALAAL